ncbi:GerAB/ArcD/ProY family transporter [Paenibacillus eucommiae]|uniref:Spore germination protein (Amino acid permease) n=1 Tax=Paenibacillus eucommiae TaxID=1355755 RepID=A0ABS4IQK8_9BACL|nr:endospore germination permease [Paenibacillus eucommiae]MBP1989844.1 spore germination protein (amino acid permease) [Paenibacillus eucommiae]
MNHSISRWQLVLMVISFLYGSSFLMAPGLTAFFSFQDAWISMFFSVMIGLLLNVVWMFLLKSYGYESIFWIVEHVGGKWLGTVINLLIVFYAVHLASYVVRNLSNFMVVSISPMSNQWTYQIMIILLAVYSCYYGLNNIARVNEFLNPWMLLLFIISVALTANQFNFNHLRPVFEQSMKSILHGSYTTIAFPFLDIILLGSVLTYVKQKEKLMKYYLTGILFAGMILVLTIFLTLGTQGPYMVIRQPYPTFSMMRDITLIKNFERVEALVAVVWIFGILVKITLSLFAALKGLQHISRHESYTSFLIPAGIITFVMSNEIHTNTVDYTDWVAKYWTLFYFTLYLILIIVLIMGKARKKS